MMNRTLVFVFSLILLLFFLTMPGCTCDDDSSEGSGQAADDDDVSDDDNDNDDTSDDDDDDDSADDDDDDDTVDDDDPVFDYPPDPGVWVGEIFFQQIAGGMPGHTGTGIGLGPDGTRYVAAECGNIVFFYTCDQDAVCTREIVDYWGSFPDLAVDSQGHAHICYANDWDYYDWDLKYATNKSGTWETTALDETDDVGFLCSIAVDSNDHAHIAYYDRTNRDLKYATDKSGFWTVESAVTDGDAGLLADIAVDSVGDAHVIFANNSEGLGHAIFYATNKTGLWEYEGIFDGIALYSSIAVDENGFVHVAHDTYNLFPYDADNKLIYTTNQSGAWQSVLVDGDKEVGLDPSIGIDSTGRLHISYWSQLPDERLRYATNKNGTWEVVVVDGNEGEGLYTSLAIDSDDDIHISHHDWERGKLLLTKSMKKGTETSVIDLQSDTGDSAFDLNLEGKPFLAYVKINSDGSNLSFANLKEGIWTSEVVDNENYTGNKCSLAIDNLGNINIVYRKQLEDFNFQLKFATNSSGEWANEILDELINPYANGKISIVALSENNIHIANLEGGLHHLTNQSGAWESYLIDPDGDDAGSILMDDNNTIQIIYGGDGVFFACYQNESWTIEQVDLGSCGQNAMIKDSNGFFHVAYFLWDEEDFRYATNEGGEWLTESFEMDREDPSIAVDSDGFVHITNSLGYAAKTFYLSGGSGNWEESFLWPGVNTEINIDSNNIIHAIFNRSDAIWYAAFPAGYHP